MNHLYIWKLARPNCDNPKNNELSMVKTSISHASVLIVWNMFFFMNFTILPGTKRRNINIQEGVKYRRWEVTGKMGFYALGLISKKQQKIELNCASARQPLGRSHSCTGTVEFSQDVEGMWIGIGPLPLSWNNRINHMYS